MRTAIALLAGIVFTACCPTPPPAPQPASDCLAGTAPSTRAQLDACLKGLVFDTSYGASDEQPLAVITTSSTGPRCPGDTTKSCRYGPIARIEPAIGAQRYSDSDLRQGRIIARLSIPATEREGYPKYGLNPGDLTYWWVRTDSDTSGISKFITRRKDGSIDTLPSRALKREPDKARYEGKVPEEVRWQRAYARWIWSLKDEEAKVRCGSGGCS